MSVNKRAGAPSHGARALPAPAEPNMDAAQRRPRPAALSRNAAAAPGGSAAGTPRAAKAQQAAAGR